MKRILVLAALSVLMTFTPALWAATFTVTTNADSGAGSLRKAIMDANATAGADEIIFDGVAGTIGLTSALPPLAQSLTITGPGADSLTIDGGQHESIFQLASPGGNQVFAIQGLTLTNGRGSDGGGAIAAFAGETLKVSRSVITGNFGDGKGHGGGIGSEAGTLTVEETIISDNETVANGGGIEIHGVGSVAVIRNSLISGNRAISNDEGSGGGVVCEACTLDIVNSTISGNSSNIGGGGIANSGTTTLLNVTVFDNTADADGIPNTSNGIDDGGGISNSGTLALKNSIVAGNHDNGGEAPDCDGTLASEDFNLIGEIAGCTITGATTHNASSDPLLAGLSDNGGLTFTHALLSGSPALNAGDPAGCVDENGDLLTVDQRGFKRPVGSACDMGAFEAGGCGDGVQDVASGEECDDANNVDTDECKNDCTLPVAGGTGAGSTGGGTSGGNDSGGGCSLIR